MAMSAKLWLVLFIIVASCAAPAAEAPQRTQSAAVIPPRAPTGSTPSTTADVPQRVNAGPIPTQRVAPTPLAGLLAEFRSLAAAALNQEPLPRPPLPFEGLKPPHVYDREGAGLKPSQLELLGMVLPLDVVFRGKIEPNTVSSTLVVTPDWHSWTRFSTFDRWASWATPAPPAFAQLGEAVEALQAAATHGTLAHQSFGQELGVPESRHWTARSEEITQRGIEEATALLRQGHEVLGYYFDDVLLIVRRNDALYWLRFDVDAGLVLDGHHVVTVRPFCTPPVAGCHD